MDTLASIDLNLLVSLDLLLEERSVRGAAARASVTPSAMSHTLGRLRTLLDDQVLVRAGRSMVPTARAEALERPVKDLLARARSVLSHPDRFDPATLKRRFVLVCTDHVSVVLLGAAEARLAEEAPGVDLVVAPLLPETMDDLRKGRVDAAVGVFPEAAPEVRMKRLFTDRFVAVCRPGHPRLAVGPLSLQAYLDEAHLLVAPRGTPVGRVDRVLEAQGLQRRVARSFPSFLAALWHLTETDAVLTVSARLVEAVRDRLDLTVLEVPLELERYPLMLAWHPRSDGAAEDAWFRSVLVRAAEALPPL